MWPQQFGSDSKLGWIWTAAVEIQDLMQLLNQQNIRPLKNRKEIFTVG